MYSRGLLEFTKENIMEMCPKNVVDTRVPKRDDDNRLVGPPIIIELEFKEDTLNSHIIIRGERIQLQMEKERPTLFEKYLQFGHPKEECRKEECTIVGGFPLLQRILQDRRQENKWRM